MVLFFLTLCSMLKHHRRTRNFACHLKELCSLLSGPIDTPLNAIRHSRADHKDRPQVPLGFVLESLPMAEPVLLQLPVAKRHREYVIPQAGRPKVPFSLEILA